MEGRIFSKVEDGRGILLEVSCETDFVAKNEEFIALGEKLMASALEGQKDRFDDLLSESIGRIKENIALRRMRIIENQPDELLVDYIHGEGRIGVLVRFHLSDEKLKQLPRVKEVAFDLALHAAAFAPHFLRRENVDAAYLAEQEEIFLKQAEKLGKPESLITHVADRLGHDRRYAIDAGKIMSELSWKPSVTFEQGISYTIDWYLGNKVWLDSVACGDYQKYYDSMYSGR